MTKKVGFVILHYGSNKIITCDCVSAINQLDFTGTIDIVVVCNGKEYDISDDIGNKARVLMIEENRGFSVGNNIGYEYLRSKGDYDFIIVLNNDVIIEQKDFITKLYTLYSNSRFYVGGPDVYTPQINFHSNPLRDHVLNDEEIVNVINNRETQIEELRNKFSFKSFKLFILESRRNWKAQEWFWHLWRKIIRNNKEYQHYQENVVLQGSCLIFSRDFIKVNSKAFVPEVFLYFEEDYLTIRCISNGWKIVYTNDLQVMHYHRGSSGLIGLPYRKYCEKKAQIDSVFIESAKQYRKFIMKSDNSINRSDIIF